MCNSIVPGYVRFSRKSSIALLLVLVSSLFPGVYAQNKDTVKVKDLGDIFKQVFKIKTDSTKPVKAPKLAILPTLSYNPSFGFVIGAKISAGKQFGNPENTNLSIFGIEGIYTSKGIISVQARHNLFMAGNRWNFQGNWQLAKYGVIDYGIGTGNSQYRSDGFIINEFPSLNSDSSFPIKYTYLRLTEKIYRKIGRHWFAGGGISIDIRDNIEDQKQTNNFNTPHQRYSLKNRINPEKYYANGLLIALQYNTREHPLRSYGGIYADLSFRFNQEWLGSTKDAVQLQYDFRKYWSLSKRNPEHVIAFWHWASYKLGGTLPYLELPTTASDTYNRSGRGYTLSRFKGPSYACFETEYRFPITPNKFLSGVCFLNMQSASDQNNFGMFTSWEPGVGAGLRLLFQKQSRTTLCVDYAKGRYGSSGIFFGLNEVF